MTRSCAQGQAAVSAAQPGRASGGAGLQPEGAEQRAAEGEAPVEAWPAEAETAHQSRMVSNHIAWVRSASATKDRKE